MMSPRLTCATVLIAAATLTTVPAAAFQSASTAPQITVTAQATTGAGPEILQAGFKKRFNHRGNFGFKKKFGKRFDKFGHGSGLGKKKLHSRKIYKDDLHGHDLHHGHAKKKIFVGPFVFIK